MSPSELNDAKQERVDELAALKKLFGGLLLESNGTARQEDIAYYQRKFKEAQQFLQAVQPLKTKKR